MLYRFFVILNLPINFRKNLGPPSGGAKTIFLLKVLRHRKVYGWAGKQVKSQCGPRAREMAHAPARNRGRAGP
jgi:hypothetical protein